MDKGNESLTESETDYDTEIDREIDIRNDDFSVGLNNITTNLETDTDTDTETETDTDSESLFSVKPSSEEYTNAISQNKDKSYSTSPETKNNLPSGISETNKNKQTKNTVHTRGQAGRKRGPPSSSSSGNNDSGNSFESGQETEDEATTSHMPPEKRTKRSSQNKESSIKRDKTHGKQKPDTNRSRRTRATIRQQDDSDISDQEDITMYEGNPKEKSTGNYRIELRQDTATSALEKKFHIQFKTQISRLLKTRFPIAHDDDEIQKLVHRRTCVNSDTTEGGSGTSWKEYLVKWGFSSYRKCCWISADRLDTEFNFSTNRKRFDKRFDKLVNDGKAFEYTKRSTGNSTSSPIEPRDWSLEDGINLEALEPEDIIMSLDPADESTLLLVEENHRESIKERMFLVKWCGLSICESTWETASSLHDDELIKYHNAIRDRFSLEGVKSRKNGISPKTGYMHMFHKERDLLPHQVVGANWIAASCISPSHSAILADDRGLGKIAQTVVALKKLRESTSDPFLIVSSCQTLAQWKDTFKTWSDFVCVMYNGSPEERNIIREFQVYEIDNAKVELCDEVLYKFDVLITSYEMFTVDLSFLKGIHWGCVVADDAHRLRGINSKIRAGFRDLSAWCRVIIPRMPILDNLNEMWSMLNLTNHNNFDSFDKFASLYKEKGDSILESHLLHRTSSIDTCTIPMHSDFVLEVELTDTQKVLYSSILKTCQEQLFIQSKEVATKIVHGITDLLGCCNHPLVVAHSDDCVNDNKGVEKSGKMNLLGKLLEMLYAEGKHRAVVCTRSTRTLDIMEQLVLSRGQPYERIDISMHRDNREQAAARFRKSPATITTVALLCLAPDSFTVDLCTANILIMYDSEWDNQYTEACLRCCWAGCEGTESHSGEERKIAVFRLVTRDTCEAYLHNYAMGDAEIPEAAGLGRVQCDIKTMNKQSLNTLLRYSTFAILEGAQKTDLKKDVFELPPAGNRKLILTTRALRCIKEEAEPTTVDVNDTDFWEKIFHRATESAEPQQNTTKSTKKRDESSSNSSSISDEGDESYAEDEEEEEGYGEGEYNDLENSDPCTTKSTDTSKKRGARCKKEWTRTKRDKLRTIISGHGWECPEQAQVITNENQTKESVQSQARALLACYLNNVKREHAIYFAREITGVNLTARGLAAEPCIQSWMLIPDPMYQMAIKLPVAERDAAADDELTYKEPSFLAYLKANSEAQLKQILFVTRIQKLAANNFVGFVPCNKPFVPGWTTEDDKQLVCACVRWGINRFNKKMFNSSIKLSVTFAKRNSADSKKHAAMAAPSKKEFIRRLKRIVRTNFGSQLNKQSHKNSSQVSSATMPKSSKELPSFPFSLSDIKPGIESDCDDDDDDDDSGPGKDIGAEACCPDPSKVPGFKSLCSIANIEKGFYARCVSCLDEAIPITPRVPIPNVVSITGKPKAHTRSQEFNNLCSISLNDPLKMGIAGILSNEAPLITTTSTVLKQSSTQRLQQLPRTDNGLNMLQQGPVSNTAISQLYPNLQYLGTPPTESKHKHKHRHHHHHLYNSNVAQNANTGMCQPLPQALSASVAQEIRPLTETLDLVPPQKLASGGDQLLYNSSPTSYYVQFKRAQPQGAQLQQQQMITQSLCAQGWQQQQQQQQSGTIHFSSHPKRHISSSIADKLNDHERFVLVNTIMDQGIPRIGDLLNWEELKNRCKFCDKTATSVKRAFKDIIKTGAVVSGSKDKTIVSKLIKAFDFFMMIDTYIRKFKEMILLTSKHWVPCKTFPEWWTCAADVELIVGLAKFGLTNVWRGMTSFSPSYFYAKYREIGERLSAKLGRVASNIEVINAMNLPNKEEVTQRVMQIMEWCNIIQPNSQQQYQPQSQSQRATVPFATNIAQQQQQQQPMSIPQQPAPPLQFTANAYNGQAQEQIHFQSRMPQPPPPQMQTQEQAQPPPVSQDVANLSKLTFSQDNVGNIIYETPIKINDNLTVMSLGIIDLSPGFHNENYIYPCGYSVIRDIRNPRCMSDKVPCHCIVYRGDDGPMFRVNCSQGTYEGKTPTIAWGLLLMGYGYKKEEIYPRFGEALFGFDSSLVTYIIQALPGAKRCTRYKFRVVPTQGSPMPRGNRNSRLCFRV